jgi:hypothetical protein
MEVRGHSASQALLGPSSDHLAQLSADARTQSAARRSELERRETLGRDVGADSSATGQPRLWLTTSTLCLSGSSTNAP